MEIYKTGITKVKQITINKGGNLDEAINNWTDTQPDEMEIVKNDIFELKDQIILIITYRYNLSDLFLWVNRDQLVNLMDVDRMEFVEKSDLYGKTIDCYSNQILFTMKNGDYYLSERCSYQGSELTNGELYKILQAYRSGEINSKNVDTHSYTWQMRRSYGIRSYNMGFDMNYGGSIY